MLRSAVLVEQRKNTRVQLELPVRIRWQSPLGMRVETAKTLDVSREGLLIERQRECAAGSRVWVIYPYHRAASPTVHTETPAEVTRVEKSPGGGFRVGLRFLTPLRSAPGESLRERRVAARICSAVPVFVRPMGSAWPEESMTQDLSRGGMRFESSYGYAVGDLVRARIPWGEWAQSGELPGRVLRVDPAGGMALGELLVNPRLGAPYACNVVAVQWIAGA